MASTTKPRKRTVSAATLARLKEMRRRYGLGEFKKGSRKRRKSSRGYRKASKGSLRGYNRPVPRDPDPDFFGPGHFFNGFNAANTPRPSRDPSVPSGGNIVSPDPNPRSGGAKRSI